MNNYHIDDIRPEVESTKGIELLWIGFMLLIVTVGSLAMPIAIIIESVSDAIKHLIGWPNNN